MSSLMIRAAAVFTARRYGSAVYAVVVCLSVRPSVTRRYCIKRLNDVGHKLPAATYIIRNIKQQKQVSP